MHFYTFRPAVAVGFFVFSRIWKQVPDVTRWYKNEGLPKSDDFRYNAVGMTHISDE